MEKTYFCVGYTNSYGYNHGMIDYDFITTDDKYDAIALACELGNEAVRDYSSILLEEYDNDYEEMLSEESCSDCYIVNVSTDKDIDDLFDLVDECGVEDFIDKFCEGV